MNYQFDSMYKEIPVFRRNQFYYIFLDIEGNPEPIRFYTKNNLEALVDTLINSEKHVARLPVKEKHPLYEEILQNIPIEDLDG